jgi:toxin FitB
MLVTAATSVVTSAMAVADGYFLDTGVVSEIRKGQSANPGVRESFAEASHDAADLYLPVITISEVRRGVDDIRHRGNTARAKRLERWLGQVATAHAEAIPSFDEQCAHVWGRLLVPNPENPLDKQIAAIALIQDLLRVTRNTVHYAPTGIRLLNPYR